jgi:fructan beta-fructosidase
MKDFSDKFAGVSSASYDAGDKLEFHLYTDASSCELFVDGGRLVMTNLVFPSEPYSELFLFADDFLAVEDMVLSRLSSIWR